MCQGGDTGATSRSCHAIGRRTHVVENKGSLQDSYDIGKEKIGRGGFGSVFLGTHKSSRAARAIKSVPHGDRVERKLLGGRTHEADIMAAVDHPNIVRLFETFQDRTHIHLVIEMCAGGNLEHRLLEAQAQRFSPGKVSKVMRQVVHAVCHMHTRGICHRDLKLENMLLLWQGPVESNVVKVADFGLSCTVSPGEVLSAKVGTLRYWSPEVANGRYDRAWDVWSCGVATFRLLSGRLPFDGKRDEDVVAKIKRGNYAFAGAPWEVVPEAAKTFVRGLLRFDARERLTAGGALEAIRDIGNRDELYVATSEMPQTKVDAIHAGIVTLAQSPAARRAALRALAWQTEEVDAQGLCSLFLALDFDGDGLLSAEELLALRSWPNPSVVEHYARKICPLDYTDFLVMMHGESLCLRTKAYRAAFASLDRDGDGKISAGDLQGLPGITAEVAAPEISFQDFTDEVRTLHL